jgi:hypothetical protein
MIDAAQHAAAAGDYAAAERLLRDAAATQEATLDSSHPDLATTLNNLAFICERTGKVDEAERGYRRAHAIAVASLSPGHPFIKTSLSNLVEFCEARGIPLWTPPETPTEDEPLPDDVDVAPSVSDVEPPAIDVAADVGERAHRELLVSRLPLRMMAVAAVVVAAIVAMVFARQRPEKSDTPQPVAQTRSESADPRAPLVPTPSTPIPPAAPEPTDRPERREATSSASVTVLNAQLCRVLERVGSPDWQCTPATGEVLPPGTYTFYTRLVTTTATTIEHRWYRNDRVHQAMRLHVSASPGSGFRTFSVTTVSPERAGEWKVELRAADGSLLDEASFRVR